uniref:trypsin n=1 Tax=Erpetoichthys calabaricus TaxID=27687 RepID=A0A8C4T867_ERPCA
MESFGFLYTLTGLLSLPSGVSGDKIIDGTEAVPHSRPYMAFLMVKEKTKSFICGGSLIRPNVVLTAAHCKGESFILILGAHNFSKNEKSQQVIPVQEMIPHEKFEEKTLKNDIMLLKLKYNATITNEVKVINLPSKDDHDFKPGSICLVAGWGRTATNGRVSNTLREVNVKIQEYCDSTSLICARGSDRKGTCSGDSGGPLVCQGRNNVPTAVGIVSYASSESCENPQRSNVYIKVSAHLRWIESKIAISSSA